VPTASDRITIAAVGDVSTGHEPPGREFEHVLDRLRAADLRFAQAERVYSDRGQYQEQVISKHSRQPPRFARAFKSVPFDVVSIASNHTGSWGPESVIDTADAFRALGIPAIGAGRNITEARKPAIVECKGTRIAFLGYVSVILPQFWANETRAGAVPMRAHTYYEPYEFQPGAPPRVVTVPHAADLEHLVADVRDAKAHSDLVFVSFHWGVHHIPQPCDYQRVVAHAAIDAGANGILGHHPHQQQGVEIYRGAPIFYSMGNFAVHRTSSKKSGRYYGAPGGEYSFEQIYTLEPDPGVVFAYNRHYNESGVVLIDADRGGVANVAYLPTSLNEIGQPQVIAPGTPEFEKSLVYLNWCGKFIPGGVTDMTADVDRYQIYARSE